MSLTHSTFCYVQDLEVEGVWSLAQERCGPLRPHFLRQTYSLRLTPGQSQLPTGFPDNVIIQAIKIRTKTKTFPEARGRRKFGKAIIMKYIIMKN